MSAPEWIVQASSRAWAGGADICMNPVRGHPALVHTLQRIRQYFPQSRIVIAAPEFDRCGALQVAAASVATDFAGQLQLHFSHNESPLLRMLAAAEQARFGPAFLRIDALNMFFQPDDMQAIWALGRGDALACVKFSDDYPIQFTADYYDRAALAGLAERLMSDSPFHIHPKYALMRNPRLRSAYHLPRQVLDDAVLSAAREDARQIYLEPRDAIVGQRVVHGDTLGFHYALALPHIASHHRVLDIACGGAYGPTVLASRALHVTGADLDPDCVAAARATCPDLAHLAFCCTDVTATGFADASFDVVTSFETLEHVDDEACLRELRRILKPDGRLFLSTPQSALGHIPVNPQHRIEYPLQALRNKVAPWFVCEQVLGIKQGCIVFNDDPVGSNTFMALRKKST